MWHFFFFIIGVIQLLLSIDTLTHWGVSNYASEIASNGNVYVVEVLCDRMTYNPDIRYVFYSDTAKYIGLLNDLNGAVVWECDIFYISDVFPDDVNNKLVFKLEMDTRFYHVLAKYQYEVKNGVIILKL